jgi:hypothetical protein
LDEIRKLAHFKHFSVRVLELDGEQVTVIGPDSTLDPLARRLAGEVVEIDRDQPRLEGYEQATRPMR